MDKKKQHALREKLDIKLIKIVAPTNMSVEEYKIQCDMSGFVPSVENGMFLHWLLTADNGGTNAKEKVYSMLVDALQKKYLLDESDLCQQEYFCDAINAILLKDKDWTTKFFEAVLLNYKWTKAFDYCKRLNKAVGFTSVEYFGNGGL